MKKGIFPFQSNIDRRQCEKNRYKHNIYAYVYVYIIFDKVTQAEK